MLKIKVKVPATTANLGPGFDTFGCALGLYNTVSFEQIPDGLEWVDYPEKFATADNAMYEAFCAVYTKLRQPVPGVRISADEQVPFSRGLGSSAVMLVAGALAANEFAGRPFSRAELLQITNQIEGHPDNLAPAFFGGLTASLVDDSGMPVTRKFALHPDWKFLVFIPDFPLPTAKARSVLPAQISRADAIFNISHAALLLRALADGDSALLQLALDDRLHQPYRRDLIPGFTQISQQVAQMGGRVCISGAGPTLLCITQEMDPAQVDLPVGWQALLLQPDLEGAQIQSEPEFSAQSGAVDENRR